MSAVQRQAVMVLAGAVFLCSGCSRVMWRPGLEDPVRVATREGRLVLVYYWQALNEDCARMDRTVFRTEEVCDQMKEMIPIKLDATLQRKRAEQLGLQKVPSFLVIAPTGELLRRRSGPLDADQFLAFLVMAKLSQ